MTANYIFSLFSTLVTWSVNVVSITMQKVVTGCCAESSELIHFMQGKMCSDEIWLMNIFFILECAIFYFSFTLKLYLNARTFVNGYAYVRGG